jgi:hypothetical protein
VVGLVRPESAVSHSSIALPTSCAVKRCVCFSQQLARAKWQRASNSHEPELVAPVAMYCGSVPHLLIMQATSHVHTLSASLATRNCATVIHSSDRSAESPRTATHRLHRCITPCTPLATGCRSSYRSASWINNHWHAGGSLSSTDDRNRGRDTDKHKTSTLKYASHRSCCLHRDCNSVRSAHPWPRVRGLLIVMVNHGPLHPLTLALTAHCCAQTDSLMHRNHDDHVRIATTIVTAVVRQSSATT